jgi:hypothetical protein
MDTNNHLSDPYLAKYLSEEDIRDMRAGEDFCSACSMVGAYCGGCHGRNCQGFWAWNDRKIGEDRAAREAAREAAGRAKSGGPSV